MLIMVWFGVEEGINVDVVCVGGRPMKGSMGGVVSDFP